MTGRSQAGLAVLFAVMITAFNMRIGIAQTGPLIEQIRADTGMSSTLGGVLTTIPFLCMGLFAFVGAPLIHRFGTGRVVATGLALILAGTVLRAIGPNAAAVLLMTVPIGIGVALIGVALPVVVKVNFSDRPGAATGAYVASLSIGIVGMGLVLVPLADALGGWRPAFALTALPAALALIVWAVVMKPRKSAPPSEPVQRRETRLGLPGPGSALLGAILGLQTLAFSAMIGWMPAVYADGGWSEQTAGLTTTVIGFGTICGALLVPTLSNAGNRRVWLAVTLSVQGVGILCMSHFGVTAGWLWVVLFGLGNGSSFALLMVLPIDVSEEARGVADVAMWMLGIGFMVASTGPLVIGTLRDLTGGFTAALLILVAVSAISAVGSLLLPRRIAAEDATRPFRFRSATQ